MRFHDAHNHLQDERFSGRQQALLTDCRAVGISSMVVNGTKESDWLAVAGLAQNHPDLIVPSFGCHPWYLDKRTPDWLTKLRRHLDTTPGAGVGEIGLDRWKPDLPYAGQEEAFLAQLTLATELDRPASIHCLKAWGRMLELLQAGPRPAVGFLLHSYGGPAELIEPLARLGAYFSFPGYFLLDRKTRQRESFRAVPPDRLLLETDAPDQLPPTGLVRFPLTGGSDGRALNHPANLGEIYRGLAEILGEPSGSLAARVGENFRRLFLPRTLPAGVGETGEAVAPQN